MQRSNSSRQDRATSADLILIVSGYRRRDAIVHSSSGLTPSSQWRVDERSLARHCPLVVRSAATGCSPWTLCRCQRLNAGMEVTMGAVSRLDLRQPFSTPTAFGNRSWQDWLDGWRYSIRGRGTIHAGSDKSTHCTDTFQVRSVASLDRESTVRLRLLQPQAARVKVNDRTSRGIRPGVLHRLDRVGRDPHGSASRDPRDSQSRLHEASVAMR